MKFMVVVESAGPVEATARRFVSAVVEAGHSLSGIFFYHDGAQCGAANRLAMADEPDVARRWSELAQRLNIELTICVNTARRRAVLDAQQAKDGDWQSNLATGFRLTGLAEYLDQASNADRVVRFR